MELAFEEFSQLLANEDWLALAGQADRQIPLEMARHQIFMRDWQSRTNQWFQGKNFENSTPVGPFLITPDEIDGARDLHISCSINGEIMQDVRTSDLLFSPAELVSYISQFTTLLPGDLIASGTPSGVGMAKVPKRFLQEGEVLVSEIEGIGVISNRFVTTGQTGI